MFIEAKDDGGGSSNWTTGAISRAKLQSNITTNKPTSNFFTGRMPFLSPNQQCQSTEWKMSHSMVLLTPSSPAGLPTLSLTTNSSWLPWGRVAMPLINPLKPVPQKIWLLLLLLFYPQYREGGLKIRKIYQKLGMSSNLCGHDLANSHATEQR